MCLPVLAVIGAGRLGLHLARRLVQQGLGPVWIRGRSRPGQDGRHGLPESTVWDTWERPAADRLPATVVLAVPDAALGVVAHSLADAGLPGGGVVLHTSGLATAEEIADCRSAGTAVASWHPLQTFPPTSVVPDVTWENIPCAIEGDDPAVTAGFELARSLGMTPWRIDPAHKAEYHAAAAVAANLTHVLVAAAASTMSRLGLGATAGGDHPLRALVAASIAGALEAPGLDRLTGALARDDSATVGRHLEVLEPELATAYRALARLVSRSRATACLD